MLCSIRVVRRLMMKGFLKFVYIMAFGIFCFIEGDANGSVHGGVALYCVLGATMLLLNVFSTVTKTEDILKKTKKIGRKLS